MAKDQLKKSKFVIIPGKSRGKNINYDASKKIEFTFNPNKYTLSDTNKYQEGNNPGTSSPVIKFGQGQARTLSVELLLDTMVNEQKDKDDIREIYIEPLQKLMEIDGDLHAPPPCRVLWGSLDFKGVLESMDNLEYTLFTNQGIPVRATVRLTFKEYIPLEEQAKNPPRRSPDRRKLFKMTEDETIWHMAYTAYGDASLWRVIADANNIDDPLEIEAGKDLIIPVLDQEYA
ncbi:MAG: peptidoglycan-binding protein [Candidatus Aminicenantes bacterium]|nr:MAG: peptidoglycan-binding protein [Candidatus Aminicenantes bacterium]